jgi:hypothetical protein
MPIVAEKSFITLVPGQVSYRNKNASIQSVAFQEARQGDDRMQAGSFLGIVKPRI